VCTLVERPPTLQGLGPVALVAADAEIAAIVNRADGPQRIRAPLVAPPAGPPRLPFGNVGDAAAAPSAHAPPDAPGAATGAVPCVPTPRADVCTDREGNVRAEGRTIARARPGTRIAAAEDRGTLVVAYLADRRTSEGNLIEAWAVVPGGSPVRISEDGSGATGVDLVARPSVNAPGLVAAYLDARSAMTPIHARPIDAHAHEGLALGADAVVFVGGPPETHLALALARAEDGSIHLLMPMNRDTLAFGMALLPIADRPTEDVPAVWSLYARAVDPAPVAVATSDRGKVARLVPGAIEIGVVTASGAFRVDGAIPRAPTASLALEVDKFGALWVAGWNGARVAGSFVERWICPRPQMR
jgi:hypothetical protein